MKLSIIIVSFNTKDLLKDCLNSISQKTSKEFLKKIEIMVVDNSSTDGSVEMLKKEYPTVLIIENRENLGFSKANNIAIRKSKGDYILLLNSDTLCKKNTLEKTLNYIETRPEVGVLGCRLKNKDGSIQYSAGYLPNIINLSLWMKFIDDVPVLNKFLFPYHINFPDFYKKSSDVGWVSGAFFLVRKKLFTVVGLFDENLFMYGEEVEYCLRIAKSGWKANFFSETEIIHLKGQSGEGEKAGLLEEFKALKYIWHKHYPSWQFPLLILILKFGALLRLVLFGIILGDSHKKEIYAKAFKLA